MDGKVRSSPSLEALQYSPRASLRRSLQKHAAPLYTASASLSSIKERPRNASRPIRVSEAGAAGAPRRYVPVALVRSGRTLTTRAPPKATSRQAARASENDGDPAAL